METQTWRSSVIILKDVSRLGQDIIVIILGQKTKAKYWSCRMWSKKPVSKVSSSVDYEDQILDMIDESEAKRPGPKSSAQTPAKPSEKKKGSSKNKPGSAGEKGGKITFLKK